MNQGRLIIMRFILMIQVPPIMEKGRPEEGKLWCTGLTSDEHIDGRRRRRLLVFDRPGQCINSYHHLDICCFCSFSCYCVLLLVLACSSLSCIHVPPPFSVLNFSFAKSSLCLSLFSLSTHTHSLSLSLSSCTMRDLRSV